MIAYLDASVLLRFVLGQSGQLREWPSLRREVASVLVEVECFRTLDRLRVAGGQSDRELTIRRERLIEIFSEIEWIDLDRPILHRAANPFPTALGTLDSIHLATALLWREMTGKQLVMATHDASLALASRASGLPVIGAER